MEILTKGNKLIHNRIVIMALIVSWLVSLSEPGHTLIVQLVVYFLTLITVYLLGIAYKYKVFC